MTKGEKKALLVIGGLTLVGGAGVAIYFATRPKTTTPLQSISKAAAKGAIEEGLKVQSQTTPLEEIPDAEKLQQAQNQQTTPPPKLAPPPPPPPTIQLLKNLSQL